jgi:hypothetical protein
VTQETVAAYSGFRRAIAVIDVLFCVALSVIVVGVCAAIELR